METLRGGTASRRAARRHARCLEEDGQSDVLPARANSRIAESVRSWGPEECRDSRPQADADAAADGAGGYRNPMSLAMACQADVTAVTARLPAFLQASGHVSRCAPRAVSCCISPNRLRLRASAGDAPSVRSVTATAAQRLRNDAFGRSRSTIRKTVPFFLRALRRRHSVAGCGGNFVDHRDCPFSEDRAHPRLQRKASVSSLGPLDPECELNPNDQPKLTPRQAATWTWTPDRATWAAIQAHSVEKRGDLTITGYRQRTRSRAIATSRENVR